MATRGAPVVQDVQPVHLLGGGHVPRWAWPWGPHPGPGPELGPGRGKALGGGAGREGSQGGEGVEAGLGTRTGEGPAGRRVGRPSRTGTPGALGGPCNEASGASGEGGGDADGHRVGDTGEGERGVEAEGERVQNATAVLLPGAQPAPQDPQLGTPDARGCLSGRLPQCPVRCWEPQCPADEQIASAACVQVACPVPCQPAHSEDTSQETHHQQPHAPALPLGARGGESAGVPNPFVPHRLSQGHATLPCFCLPSGAAVASAGE
mmetsp:Transcript_299/g.744  ORF Transcript_299/g.744 Transcript_299/m.744 type:complete len:264 (+) Transcript_299:317-1108(+)